MSRVLTAMKGVNNKRLAKKAGGRRARLPSPPLTWPRQTDGRGQPKKSSFKRASNQKGSY